MSDQEAETHQRFSDAEDVSMETQETKKEAKKEVKKETKKAVKKESNKRYITFVGNLPYDVTRQDLETLFKDLGITYNLMYMLYGLVEYLSIRLLTDKVTKKPRGIAFVEFADSVNLEVSIFICDMYILPYGVEGD